MEQMFIVVALALMVLCADTFYEGRVAFTEVAVGGALVAAEFFFGYIHFRGAGDWMGYVAGTLFTAIATGWFVGRSLRFVVDTIREARDRPD